MHLARVSAGGAEAPDRREAAEGVEVVAEDRLAPYEVPADSSYALSLRAGEPAALAAGRQQPRSVRPARCRLKSPE